MVYPTLIATAVAERFGLTPDQIEQGIRQFVPTRMRMNILRRGDGITILDDTYNANPQSMRAAISVLSDSQSAYKIAVLGDMLELGPLFSRPPRRRWGSIWARLGIHCLVAVGEQATAHRPRAPGTRACPRCYHCRRTRGRLWSG